MKKKIKITGFDGKEKELEINLRTEDHFQSQLKYKKVVFRDKTKYCRKVKHKNREEDGNRG